MFVDPVTLTVFMNCTLWKKWTDLNFCEPWQLRFNEKHRFSWTNIFLIGVTLIWLKVLLCLSPKVLLQEEFRASKLGHEVTPG